MDPKLRVMSFTTFSVWFSVNVRCSRAVLSLSTGGDFLSGFRGIEAYGSIK